MAGGERRAAVNPAGTGPRRRRWLLLAAAALIAVLVGGRWLALETAEHAWAATITGGGGDAYLAARSLARLMRIVVFVVSVGWGTLHLWFIYRSIGSVQMPRRIGNLEIVEAVPQRILLAGTLLAGLAFGIGLAWGSGDWWMQALIASGAPQYGVADPILHRDVGYYVAELPWAETRQSYALLASLTAVVVVSLLYVGIGSLRFRGIRPQASPHARGHLGLLLGCLALVLAWGALLDPAELADRTAANQSGDQIPNRACQKPDAHHLAHVFSRRQLCHRRQPNGTQRQLTNRLEEVTHGQPNKRNSDQSAAAHNDIGGEDHHCESDSGQ